MINLATIAAMIPPEYRTKVLTDNFIYKAAPISSDKHLRILAYIYQTFIDPAELDLDCSFCVTALLDKFKHLQPFLVELEREDKLLDL